MTAAKVAQRTPNTIQEQIDAEVIADLLAALRQAVPILERAAASERVANRLTGGAGTQANDALTAAEFAIAKAS